METISNTQAKYLFFRRKESKDIIRKIQELSEEKKLDSTNIINFIEGKYDFGNLNNEEKECIYEGIYNITREKAFKIDDIGKNKEQNINHKKDNINIEQYKDLEFIGQSWYMNLENMSKHEILESYSQFQLNKLLFINSRYNNVRTQSTYFELYESNIKEYELQKNKDLMHFSKNELENVLNTLIYNYDTTRQNVACFIRIYCTWCFENGLIEKNPSLDLDIKKSKTNSKVFLQEQILGKSEFYEMLKEMELNTKIPNLMPLLLARYGIIGENLEKMINLKWEDIDKENKLVFIKDKEGKVICDLPIDDDFIEYIDKARLFTSENKEGVYETKYIDYGYVLKKAYKKENKNSTKTIKYASVFNRVNEACKSIEVKRISFKRLLLSRQIEILLEMRRYGRLKQEDFEYIIQLFNFGSDTPLINKAFTLKKRWEELTNDIVITQRKSTKNVDYENGEVVYNRIKKDLDLYI